MQNKIKNFNRSKSEILRLLYDIVVFRLVTYLLNMVCLYYEFYTKSDIYTIWYTFYTVLYQFLETGTSDRCLIYIIINLRFSGFSLYPLSFFLYSPFKINIYFSSNKFLSKQICLPKLLIG